MQDNVFIQGLELESLIGVYDFERHQPQKIIIDVLMRADLAAAAESDDLADTLDYGAICERLADIAQSSDYKLLEALGQKMLTVIFNEFSVSYVELTVHKPDIIANAKSVGVTMCRHRDDMSSSGSKSSESQVSN